MPQKVGVALFGIGRAGTIHFNNIIRNPRLKLLWLVEEDLIRARQVLEDNYSGDTQICAGKELENVLKDPSVKAAIIATPTATHEHYVTSALKAGKGVFCEKPISCEISGAIACYDEAVKQGKPLLCAFNRRFDPSFQRVKKRVESGEIGQIRRVKTCSRDSPFPNQAYLKISGGIFHDCAVHDIDIMLWMVGEAPVSIYTQAHAFHQEVAELKDVDTVAITMKFPSGTIGTIDLSRKSSYGYDQRLEIFGSEGNMLQVGNHLETSTVSCSKAGTQQDMCQYSFPERYHVAYAAELDHFVDVLLNAKSKLEVSKDQVVLVSRVAEACEQSYRSGKPIDFISFNC